MLVLFYLIMKNKLFLVFCLCLLTFRLIAQPGTLDNTFDKDGKLTTGFSNNAIITGMKLQTDGKIVVCGNMGSSSILVRYNKIGELDKTFGTDGVKILADIEKLNTMSIQPDQKIVVAGMSDNSFVMARYHSTGALDTGFGSHGIKFLKIVDFSAHWNEIQNLIIEHDGNILVSGTTGFAASGPENSGILLRFSKDGKSVIAKTGFQLPYLFPTSLSLQKDGKIILVRPLEYNLGLAISRYNPDLTLDTSFNKNGGQLIKLNLSDCYTLIQDDGKILVSGGSWAGVRIDFAMVRCNIDGSLDSSFGNNGIVITKIQGNANPVLAVLQPDGKIILSGEDEEKGLLIRYLKNGTIDSTFGINGNSITTIGNAYEIRALLIQTDGKIIAAGNSNNGTKYDFALSRYHSGLNLGLPKPPHSRNFLLIFPNPILNNTTIEYNLEKEDIISICLIDAQGKLIKTFFENIKQPQGHYKQTLSFPDNLASGDYYIIFSNPTNQTVVKILKK